MKQYKGIVKWNGNHYFSGEEIKGSKIEWRGDELWIFDDDENYILGLGDFTSYEWVEIKPESLEENV